MTQVEIVALWAGLLSSVVSVVLSIVAIVFAILVDRRSSRISDQTIQSLQKIESAVERLSSDTSQLIKAGWDKMLGTVGLSATSEKPSEDGAKRIAEGIAAELRAELTSTTAATQGGRSAADIERLESLIRNLETSLVGQLKAIPPSRPSEALDRLFTTLSGLRPAARALVRAIVRHHLSQEEYKKLAQSEFSDALNELRESGLLIPVSHRGPGDERIPCYYFPPGLGGLVRAALPLLPRTDGRAYNRVQAFLKEIGYPSDHPGHEATPEQQ